MADEFTKDSQGIARLLDDTLKTDQHHHHGSPFVIVTEVTVHNQLVDTDDEQCAALQYDESNVLFENE